MIRNGIGLFVCILLSFSLVSAGSLKPVQPSPRDKCPVCGMFVSKYPDWTAEIIFKDGSYAVFDGAKDLFKYYLNLKKYNPAQKVGNIDSVYVKDYYNLTFFDGSKGFYVTGSDVYGPMGHELIPFSRMEDAQEFMKDHNGKTILRFEEIHQSTIQGLD